jgi:hypothetical protein
MAYSPLTKLPQQFFDNLGDPLSGGTLESYVAGTTTPTNMFSDDAGTVAGTSVTLDSRGEPTTIKQIWLDETVTYKFILKDSSGSTIWTVDDVPADPSQGVAASITIADAGGYYTGTTVEAALQEAAVYSQEGTGAITRTVDARLKEVASALDYGVTGDGVADDSTNFGFANTAVSTRGKTILVPGGKTIQLDSNASLSAGNVLLLGPGSKFTRDSGVTFDNAGLIVSAGGFDSQLSGTSAQTIRGFYFTINGVTGASTSSEPSVLYHGVNISGDNLEVEANSTNKNAVGWNVSMAAGGTAMTGARDALSGTFTLTAASASGSTVRNYKGLNGVAVSNVNDNGTGGTKAGNLYGVQGSIRLDASATHFDTVTAFKASVEVGSSTAPGKRYGLLVVNDGDTIADRGVAADAMIGLTDATSSSTGTWSTGILFGDMSGQHPVAAAGTLIKTTGSGTVTDGIDLSSYTFTGSAIKSSGREKFISATGFDMTSSTSPDSAVLTIGDADTTGYIYLLSNTANEYDSRIFTTAGTGGDGNGTMTLDSQKLQISAALLLQLSEIDDYADDAAAATGGVSVGQVYRTGSTLKVRVS